MVGGLEPWNFMTFHILGEFSSSQLTNSYFSEGWLNHQPDCDVMTFLTHKIMLLLLWHMTFMT